MAHLQKWNIILFCASQRNPMAEIQQQITQEAYGINGTYEDVDSENPHLFNGLTLVVIDCWVSTYVINS